MDAQAATQERIHCLRPLLDLPERKSPSSPTSDITSAVVRLLLQSTGRGPTAATTAISSNLAVVTLSDCLTTAERTLADRGDRASVIQLRAALHDGIRAEAIAAVEAIVGRRVIAYLTAQEVDPDVAILAFYFGR